MDISAIFGGRKPGLEEITAFNDAVEKYSFIRLRLTDTRRAVSKCRMHAIDKLIPKTRQGEGGMLVVDLELSSGILEFMLTEDQTQMVADVLDTPNNRRWLAQHKAFNLWKIVDKTIDAEIQVIADEITRNAIIAEKKRPPVEKVMSDEALEDQIARLTAEQANRKLNQAKSRRTRPLSEATQKAYENSMMDVDLTDVECAENIEPTNEAQVTPGEMPIDKPTQRPRRAKRKSGLVKTEA